MSELWIFRRNGMAIETKTPKTTVSGATAILRTLMEEGTRYIFGVAGTSEIPLVADLPSFDEIRYLIGLHESVAVGMADGFARATRAEVGIALLHATQGTLNGIGYERAAFRDGVPLIVISGAPGQSYTINEPNHFLSGLPTILNQITKWTWSVSRPNEIPWALHRGLALARCAPQGPVHLLIPQNCMMEEVELATSNCVRSQVRDTPQPADDVIDEIVTAVASAKRVLLYAGNGVARAGAVHELVQVAELLNAPVIAEAVDRGPMVQAVNFPADHPSFLGFFTRDAVHISRAFEDSDLVVVLGAKTTYERVIGNWIHHTKIVQIDPDGWEIGKNHPCALGVVADLRLTLAALAARLRQSESAHVGLPWTVGPPQPTEDASVVGASAHITPEAFAKVLNATLDKDTVIVDDSQSLSGFMKRFYRFTRPGTLYGSLASHLGWGLPAALGVQLGRPDDQVVALISDGSLLFAPQALWTAARYSIPITVVVANNGGFRSLRQELRAYNGMDAADAVTSLTQPQIDIAGLAMSLGVQATVVRSTHALADALRTRRRDGPVLLDVRMSENDSDWQSGWLVPPHETV
jgi:benzoylformate decarboxylase